MLLYAPSLPISDVYTLALQQKSELKEGKNRIMQNRQQHSTQSMC